MKRILNSLGALFLIICMLSGALSLFSCNIGNKYTYDKYVDIAYGEHERQALDICIPRDREGEVGLILIIHGGAWVAGDKSSCAKDLDRWCGEYGYVTAAINYHYISSEYSCDDIMQDIALSLDKIKEFASEKGIDIEKAMLVGSSAGGHLSLLYAYGYADMASIQPVAVANYSGPTDLTDPNYYVDNENSLAYLSLFSDLCHASFTESDYQSEEMQVRMLEYSPISYVRSAVPTLICHGDADNVVPYSNALTLKAGLDIYGVKNDLLTYKNSGHSLSEDKEASQRAKELFAFYAETYLR